MIIPYIPVIEKLLETQCPLKGPAHRVTSSQALMLSSSEEGTATAKAQETYGEKLSSVAPVLSPPLTHPAGGRQI